MLRRVDFIGSGYECVRFVMVDTDTMAEAIEAAEKWYKETGQDFHYCELEIPKEYAYNESMTKDAQPVGKLSEKAQELLKFLREDYKESGYMYSGSWPYESLKQRGFEKEVIHELRDAGKIQRRDCDDYAFELSVEERGNLIAEHSLASVWYEKYGDFLLLATQQEVRNASGIVVGKEPGMVTVDVVKNDGDMEKPEKKDVYCPLAVGQVVELEYDLPRKLQRAGYHQWEASDGKAVGQFMVTYVCHNMLFSPGKNMIEVQSLCEAFNKVHPRERAMMVFEDELLGRMKELDGSLEDKIQDAGGRSVQLAEKDSARNFEIDKE